MIDIITIIHNEKNTIFAERLASGLNKYELENHRLIVHDNRDVNVGFAKGCNIGAQHATTEVVGFLNPDIIVRGPFIDTVQRQFDEDPELVITGCTFRDDKKERYTHIGLKTWVCGAALFARKSWFDSVGGFDESYVWSWEETDLCRQAQEDNKHVTNIILPLEHDRSHVSSDSPEDKRYKDKHMRIGKRLYFERWGV